MNKNRFKLHFTGMALVIGMLGVCTGSYGQSVPDGSVTSAKTRNGSVTYVVVPKDGFGIDIFSKEAGEPNDFAGVVQRCAAAKQQVVFAMNGGMCDKSLKPLGLLLKGDTKYKDIVRPELNVFGDIDPSGVFAIDRNNGNVYIMPGKSFNAANDLGTYRLAIQSGTMLITKGFLNPKITRAAGQQERSGIGIKANGDIVFAVTDDKMNLREFAIFFQDLNCKDAMLLDDGVNCQWYAPGKQKKPGKPGEILVGRENSCECRQYR